MQTVTTAPIVAAGTAVAHSVIAVLAMGTATSTKNVLAEAATAGLQTAWEQHLTRPMIAVIIEKIKQN